MVNSTHVLLPDPKPLSPFLCDIYCLPAYSECDDTYHEARETSALGLLPCLGPFQDPGRDLSPCVGVSVNFTNITYFSHSWLSPLSFATAVSSLSGLPCLGWYRSG